MKKAFLLAGVILDIIVISLILITSLNIINITNHVNSFVVDNKFDTFYKEAQDTLDYIKKPVDFYEVQNTRGFKIPIKNSNHYMSLTLKPFSYKEENSTFILYSTDGNASSVQKVIVDVMDNKNRKILSVDKLIY